MARRKVPERPITEAQREAFLHENPAGWAQMIVTNEKMTKWDVLAQLLLRRLPEAAEIEAGQRASAGSLAGKKRTGRKKSRPPSWEMKRAAVEHMRSLSPPVKLSDATASRCVRELAAFVTRWRQEHAEPGVRIAPCSLHTAAELAGTFLAMVNATIVETFDEN